MMLLTPRRLVHGLLFLSLALLASSVSAVQTEVKILIDSDRNISTGCPVLTAGGTFNGVEQIVSTTYDTVGTALAVTGVTRQQCVSGSFTAPMVIDAGGWPVGSLGGNQMLETHVPFGGTLTSMRLGFTISNGALSDAVLQHPNGDPIVFPADFVGATRRRAVFSGGDFPINLDGNGSDWNGLFPLAPGSASLGTAALRFLNIFATEGDADVFFRLDIQANKNAPTANDDAYTTLRGSTLTVAAPGVLGNDTDPLGASLTAVLVSGPQHGMLTLNSNGSFTYVNDGSNAPVDSFRYKANNGSADSNTAQVTLTIIAGTAPVITSANNTTFTVGTAGSFTVTKTGNPTPTLSESGTLPAGVTFNSTTGALSGTPAAGTGRVYNITFTASNLVGTTTQNFKLTVNETPSFTSANATTFVVGTAGTFTITTNGFPRPPITESGALPAGVTFTDNGNGTATLSGTPTASGIYPITFTATNGLGTATQNFTLTVNQAPAITSANNTMFTVGSAGTFTVTATGFPTPTLSESGALPGGVTFNPGSGVLSGTPNAGTGGVYTITFTATNVAGIANQTFTLTVNEAPAITTAAVNQTVCAGATATFVAAASGFPAPTVQWQISTNGGVTFTNIPGATSTTYSFVTAPADNGNQYRAVFTNSSGTAQTTATLTVNTPPAVTANPANLTVCAGASASFTATASGSPAPTVQWQRSNDGGTTFTNITGANATTYTFSTAAADNGSQYRAVFTNACGVATSTAATLTVNTAPVVTTNPATQTVCDGTTATFTAAASGTPAPTVQWQVSTDGGTTFNNLPGETATTLSFMAVLADNGKQYRAVFTNTCSTATTAAAILNVTSPPVVTTNPTNQTVCAGTSATFTAAASPAASVQWQVSTDGGSSFTNLPGATSTTLTFTAVPADNNNQYRAVFTNICGTATTTAATLTVNVAPAVTTQPTNQTVCDGATATFTAAASGTPAPTVQWQVSSGGPFTDIPGETSTTLNVVTVAADNGKQYRAVFTNSCAVVNSAAATLTVNTPPAVTANPLTQTTCSGGMASFTASASGQPTPTVQWELSIDGGGSFNPILGATSTTYSFTTNPADNGHQFRATFTNSCGTATTTAATLTVNVAPLDNVEPADQTVCAGASATFTAGATGSPTPTVQWQVSTDGGATFNDLPGETSTTLTFMTTSGQNGNKYHAVFTNVCGNATTLAATLTVNTAPVVTLESASQNVCENTTATFMAAASGSPTPTVQWELSTDNGMTFSPIPSATSTTYSFTATMADNLHQYRAVFTNVCGNATTSPATLTVEQALTITTQPTDQSVTANNPVTFTAAASGPSTVQWQVSTDGGTIFNDLPGETSPTLTFSPPLSANGNKYKALFTNSCGTVATNVVTLTVTCPAITVNPASLTNGTFGVAYGPVTFTASGGVAPYTFGLTGALPSGITFTTDTLSGTPTNTGVFTNIVVTATDANGCTGQRTYTLTIGPAGNDDIYASVGNTQTVAAATAPTTPFVSYASGVLANDAGPGLTVTAGTFATSQGGSITIASDGSFTYTPPLNITAVTDTFIYTLNSNGASSNATANFPLTNKVWYVKNDFGPGGDGRSNTPFNILTNAESASPSAGVGDVIYVMTGDGTTNNQNAGITLKNTQTLFGAGVATFTVGAVTITTPGAGTPPQIGNSAGNGVTLANGNTVKGLTVTGSSGSAIYGTLSLGTTTLDVLTLQNSTGAGLQLDNASGTVTFTTGTISGNTAAGVDVINGGTVSLTYGGNITQTAGAMVSVAGGHTGTLTFSGILSATGGTGLQFNNADGVYNFTGTTTLNGGDAGVDILAGSGGSFTFSAGTSITNPTGDAFHVNGSAPALVNYFGSISSNAAQAVSITNGVAADCGTQNFTGSITATGAGIQINNCNAGTITFSGATNTFNTAGNAAVSITSSGATVKFTGGNLTINTTSGVGFFANNGGGTVEVTGLNNTVTTTTGIGVQVLNNLISANGVTFKSVNVNGAVNGIVLGSTGGVFTVTGDGSTAGSGGTINATGAAVQIGGTTNLSFMNIIGSTGIIGGGALTVNGVTVTGSSIELLLNTATVNGTFSNVGGTNTGANAGVNLIGVGGNFTVSAGSITAGVGSTASLFSINGGNATINWQGNLTQNQNAALITINGANTGNVTFGGALSTLFVANGTGLQFDNADGTYTFNPGGGLSLNGGDAGIDILNGSSGTFSFGSTTAITNPTGTAFNVSASAPTSMTYSGNITTNVSRPVSVSNGAAAACGTLTFQTGNITANSGSNGILVNNCNSGTITFSGSAQTLTTTTNNGVTLTNNGGASIFFTGGNLDVVTTTGKAFTATGGGTIKVTGSGNTLATGSGQILEVTGTTITTGGLNFISLNGNGASSTAKGVFLQNAGTGGLTVAGTGSAGTGGTIQNYTQKGIHVDTTNNINLSFMNLTGNGTANLDATATCGDDANGTNTNCAAGIDLQTVTTVNLTSVTVSGGAQIGINGKTVSGLTFNTVTVSGAGNEALEDGVQFAELTGTNSFTSVNFNNNASRQLAVQNSTGTGTLNITGSSFTNTTFPTLATTPSSGTAAQGILYSGHGNANMTLNIQNSTFARNFAAAVFSDTQGTAVMNFTVNGGSITDNGLAIQVAGVGSGNMTYALTNVSPITTDPTHAITGPISFFRGGVATGNWTGTITGNTLGTSGVAFSGSPCTSCVGMIIENSSSGPGTHNVTIQNNTIKQTGHTAIHVATSGSAAGDVGAMNAKILNNNISEPSQAGDTAIFVLAGDSVAGDTSNVCADVSGNTITNGVNAWNAAAFIGMNERFTNVLRLPGFAGGTGAAAATFVSGQNGGVATNIQDGTDNFIGGGGACF